MGENDGGVGKSDGGVAVMEEWERLMEEWWREVVAWWVCDSGGGGVPDLRRDGVVVERDRGMLEECRIGGEMEVGGVVKV